MLSATKRNLFRIFYKKNEKIYKGWRQPLGSFTRGSPSVTVNGVELFSMLIDDEYGVKKELWEWGNRTTKATNLAVSILAEQTETNNIPKGIIYAFRNLYIATLPYDYWSITSTDIDYFLNALERSVHEKRYDLDYFYNISYPAVLEAYL